MESFQPALMLQMNVLILQEKHAALGNGRRLEGEKLSGMPLEAFRSFTGCCRRQMCVQRDNDSKRRLDVSFDMDASVGLRNGGVPAALKIYQLASRDNVLSCEDRGSEL